MDYGYVQLQLAFRLSLITAIRDADCLLFVAVT